MRADSTVVGRVALANCCHPSRVVARVLEEQARVGPALVEAVAGLDRGGDLGTTGSSVQLGVSEANWRCIEC